MAATRSPVAPALLVAALLALGAGALVLLSGGPERDSAPAGPSPRAEPRTEEPPPAVAALAEVEPEAPRRAEAREETAPLTQPLDPPAAVIREVPWVLAGTVVVEEPDGSLTEAVQGRLQVGIGNSRSRQLRDVEVKHGAWRTEILVGTGGDVWTVGGVDYGPTSAGALTLSIDGVEVADGRGGVVMEADRDARYEPGTMDVIVRVRRLGSITLEVVDADTGRHLEDVRVVRIAGGDWMLERDEHPGRSALEDLVETSDSPLTLQPSSRNARWNAGAVLVGSPGYAWTPIELDLRAGGTRRVELARGGALEIVVRGTPRPGSLVRVYAARGGRPYASCSLGGTKPIALEGVAPGEYRVRVETGMWFRSPRVDARAKATVAAGATERVELRIAELREPSRGALSGRLVLPREWRLHMFHLDLELQGASLDGGSGRIRITPGQFERVGASKDTFAFDVGEVQAGRYGATLSELEYTVRFDVGPGGRSDVLIEVPPPADITVRVVDTTTGLAADVDSLHWHPKRVGGGGLNTAERIDGEEVFRLTVPRGALELSVSSDVYGWIREEVDAVDGAEFLLEVAPVPRAILRLVDGGTPVPWPRDEYGHGEAVDGKGRLGSRGKRDGALHFNVTEAGRYRLEIPRINGFEPHGPVELDLVAGEVTEHTVELVRRR